MPPADRKISQTVFISYAHEGDLAERVAALAEWLRSNGVEVITDHRYRNRPPEKGWRAWMQHSVEDADVVLIVCSERYKVLFEKREVADSGGRGATWESAVITSDLYKSRLINTKFFPILPDDGLHEHIPEILADWDNGHRFPSGNERILALILGDEAISDPASENSRLLPGELTGASDPRLDPREGVVLGREEELAKILDFLNGSGNAEHVSGTAGIGKTAVCNEALRRWLARNRSEKVFFVQVRDDANPRTFLAQVGEAVGLDAESLLRIETVEQLRRFLPEGVYYLDNLEHVAESPGGRQMLRDLARLPGVRVLASSRVVLDGVLGNGISIERLDNASAVELFLKCWNGGALADKSEVTQFVDQELGGHALAITLLARLGRACSWQKLQKLWREQGTASAAARHPDGRLDSLDLSFALTEKLLAREPGALDLWQFVALFPDGLDEESMALWEEVSGHATARIVLVEHNLISFRAERITMLPPVSRYALGRSMCNLPDENGFNWLSARNHAYQYFLAISRDASDIRSSDANIQARSRSSAQLWAISQLCSIEKKTACPESSLMQQLHRQLRNVYIFNVLPGHAALALINNMIGDSLSFECLGDLESRLGEPVKARENYERAIQLYEKEQAALGLANALQSTGDLEFSLNEPAIALQNYRNAVILYRAEQAPMGLAYSMAEMLRCHQKLATLDAGTLTELATEALIAADQSGVESVIQYVLRALYEACDEDEDKMKALLDSLGFDA